MKKREKLTWKLLVTAIMFVMVLTTGVKAQAASWVEINTKNFPESVVRETLKNEAKNYGYSYYKRSNGKYYVDVSRATSFSCYDEKRLIKNTDFLKKFKRLNSVSIKTTDTSISLPSSVEYVYITTESDSLTLRAPGANYVSITGTGKTSVKFKNMGKLETLYTWNLKDVSGLSRMKNLVNFDTTNYGGSALNLTGNTKLQGLFVTDSPELVSLRCPDGLLNMNIENTGIRKLDVSRLKNLQFLGVNTNTNIRNIDVSKNASLTSLCVNCSNVTSLDITKNKKLTSLVCYESKLSELKIGKNNKLTYLDIKKNSRLKSVDVTKCPKLASLNVSATAIRSLNVTKNKQLTSLYAAGNKNLKRLNVTKCPKLNELYVNKTGITNLNVSRNKKLQYLGLNRVMTVKGCKNVTLSYYNMKKGMTVSLKGVIGSGYKKDYCKGARFNPKTMKIQFTPKKDDYGHAYVTLVKGSASYDISLNEGDVMCLITGSRFDKTTY